MKKFWLFLLVPAALFGMSKTPTATKPYAVRTFKNDNVSFIPGTTFYVTLTVYPSTSTRAFALEETPPVGFPILKPSVDNGGSVVGGMIKWGIFYTTAVLKLNYSILPSENLPKVFKGTASFDGKSKLVIGSTTTYPQSMPTPPPPDK